MRNSVFYGRCIFHLPGSEERMFAEPYCRSFVCFQFYDKG